MAWTTHPRVVALRRRSTLVDVGVETLNGWRMHQTGRNASVLSLFGFLSIFPLLLVATSVLGFVLQDNPELQEEIIEGTIEDIPVIGAELAEDPASISGSGVALVVGLLTALWSATRVFVGMQRAFDDTWDIPVDQRAPFQAERGKAVVGIIVVGGAQVATIGASMLLQQARLPGAGRVAIAVTTLALNVVVLGWMFRFMTTARPNWRAVLPGAVTAGIAVTVLQYFGTRITTRVIDGASDTYGQFAVVLGLITWLGFLAIAVLMSAELNAALVKRGVNGDVALPEATDA